MPWSDSAVNALRSVWSLRARIRPRFRANFWVCLIGLIPLVLLVWFLDLFSSLRDQALMTIMYATILLLSLFTTPTSSASSRWRPSNGILAMVVFLLVACGILISKNFGITALLNALLILLLTSPLLYPLAMLFRRPLMPVALVPAMIIALVYLIVAELPEEEWVDLFLLPLPLVLVVSLPWAGLALLCLKAAERRRKTVKWGPATEALAMLVLFLPTITLSVLVPIDLELGEVWQAVPVTIVGILFSSVVSVPLRQFLLDLGNLPPNGRWEG